VLADRAQHHVPAEGVGRGGWAGKGGEAACIGGASSRRRGRRRGLGHVPGPLPRIGRMFRAPWVLASACPLATLFRRRRAAGPLTPGTLALAARAHRVDHNTAARHISPEGVPPTATPGRHRRPASVDILPEDDTGIWTGAYAAAMACRWHATRDPEARCSADAPGGRARSALPGDGRRGCISLRWPARASARRPASASGPLAGAVLLPGSERHPGRRDASAGSSTYVEDPRSADASRNLGAIARRLWSGR
jgi:hypothetical protein